MRIHLVERQDRGEARVGAREHLAPLVPRSGEDRRREAGSQQRPPGPVTLGRKLGEIETETRDELGVELRLDSSDGHVPAIRAQVRAVVGGSPVEDVRLPGVDPPTSAAGGPDELREHARAVEDGGVDDLAEPGGLTLPQCGEDADEQEKRSATVVTDQVQRRHRAVAARADRVQDASQAEVVDVVSGGLRQGAVLPPTGDPPIDQARVQAQAVVRAQAEPFGHSRAEPLDEHVRLGHQAQHASAAVRRLQVGVQDAPPSKSGVTGCDPARPGRARALDADHVGAEVGQDHRGVRSGPDTRQLHHAQAAERSGHDSPRLTEGGRAAPGLASDGSAVARTRD
ncbi:hypothetical protein BL253_08765 [Pseudofrankia asymbiotica]|uniref:Uncharacterized protein n=1 Tax=Pseudofrankia asymbiotica TaxID=1834516 RepID=A0A1V2IF45_9ACTN|nr:hypothetical protein BL253_08765 [Pseudofrankia asymbiotica]